uniref:Uncharacterized protein n=1 Tax=Octopus bimaculoides TaxID=37653 RepID=A0A0L8I9Q6_OCTBM
MLSFTSNFDSKLSIFNTNYKVKVLLKAKKKTVVRNSKGYSSHFLDLLSKANQKVIENNTICTNVQMKFISQI